MKKCIKILGIFALAAIFGFLMVACDDFFNFFDFGDGDGGGGGTTTYIDRYSTITYFVESDYFYPTY
jgi:hypothetical protein